MAAAPFTGAAAYQWSKQCTVPIAVIPFGHRQDAQFSKAFLAG
jgi:hypothetical protein